jgi:hypothetical protein
MQEAVSDTEKLFGSYFLNGKNNAVRGHLKVAKSIVHNKHKC